jgi:hypothetical protein
MADEEAMAAVCRVKGLGEWSTHMFLMFSLGRADVFPRGDLAIRKVWDRDNKHIFTYTSRQCPSHLVWSTGCAKDNLTPLLPKGDEAALRDAGRRRRGGRNRGFRGLT